MGNIIKDPKAPLLLEQLDAEREKLLRESK